jgi:putative restriction endonuclease
MAHGGRRRVPRGRSKEVKEAFLEQLGSLRVWQRGDERAPHKPLLLLYALARVSRAEERLVPYAEAREPLERLLKEFGPARRVYHPEQPFVRLESDGIWEVRTEKAAWVAEGEPTSRKLLDADVRAGFPDPIHRALAADPALVRKSAEILLEAEFPGTLHDEILTELGFDFGGEGSWVFQARRDPTFRARVLLAYAFRCAVCDFHLQIDHAPLGLDAAHIRWKQLMGPDLVNNGLSLCTLHHRLFDRGAFTVNEERRVLVSGQVVGDSLKDALMRFHGSPVQEPREPEFLAGSEHLAWHGREVFRGPARGLTAS